MDFITEQEKSEFKKLLSTIYGAQVNSWNINMKVLKLFGELMQSSESCSRYIDFVPRPFVAGSVIKWANKQARGAEVIGDRPQLRCYSSISRNRELLIVVCPLFSRAYFRSNLKKVYQSLRNILNLLTLSP